MKSKILGLLAVGLLAGPMVAQAVPVIWYLRDVTFTDGGTASGSFVYDFDGFHYSSISITTTGNFAFTYNRYAGGGTDGFDMDTGSRADGTGSFQLIAMSEFTNAGGTIALRRDGEFTSVEGMWIGGEVNQNTRRFLASGYVIGETVTEPGTLALLGLGLAGLGLSRRRKAA